VADKGETRASVVKIGGRPERGAHVTLGIAGFPNDYGEPHFRELEPTQRVAAAGGGAATHGVR